MIHYLYKITNLINGKYYYGVHSTNNIDDGYMGSGNLIIKAINKYGKENFKKEILEYFDTEEEKYKREAEVITENILLDPNCYNIKIGGCGASKNRCFVEDLNGNIYETGIDDPLIGKTIFKCSAYKNINDEIKYISTHNPLFKSNEYVSIFKNKLVVKDKNGNIFQINKNDPRYISGELTSIHKGKLTAKDKDGNIYYIDKNDPKYISGELVSVNKGNISVKDKDGNTFCVNKNDPRLKTGELVGVSKGYTTVRDENNKYYQLPNNHPDIKSGKYLHWMKNYVVVFDKIENHTKRINIDEFKLDNNNRYTSIHKNKSIYCDHNGNKFYLDRNDPKIKENNLYSQFKNKIVVKDKDGNTFCVDKNDPRLKTGELFSISVNKIVVKDKNGNVFQVDRNDPRYISGELVSKQKNKVTVKDKYGKGSTVDITDPRYLSGELTPANKNIVIAKDSHDKIVVITKEEFKKGNYKGTTAGTIKLWKNNKPYLIDLKLFQKYINNGYKFKLVFRKQCKEKTMFLDDPLIKTENWKLSKCTKRNKKIFNLLTPQQKLLFENK